ncbi:TadE family protein [Pseudomonas daroniae]|uniref:TadE family protein n=1 Tax=Phytopseudomonas daroniae TaxID=2487519 RepID=A0A4Q9QR55_9GAMM|nr:MULTISPECIES: TadE/TadG family type IV pilus assembly protein [Pseudomonas]TBU81612.1 TadE family protein [Pseudomonas daroniae]TBU84223.1 TadE family protein [Pseudomonas sp. FRB 228]TBU88552.1 TadE family protein [Pseudomonas daroniae]
MRRSLANRQQGAVAIEFAMLFGVFFVVVYGIIAYSIPMLLMLTFKQVSADAARATLQVNPASSSYVQVLSREITRTVEQSWLPESWRGGDCPAPEQNEAGYVWSKLPGSPSYGHIALDARDPNASYHVLHVCLQRFYNREGATEQRAIVPTLRLFNIDIPSLPERDGNVVIRGETTVTL